MKKKISKLFGVVLAVILITSLFGFTIPVSAAAPLPTINAWDTFDYPVAGATGGWFWSPNVLELGPMDKALNGDLYIYADIWDDSLGVNPGVLEATEHTHHILRSTDGGRSWAESTSTLKYGGTAVPGLEVVDMVCSSLLEDVLYVTDGNYVYKSSDNATTWGIVGQADLEKMIEGDCGIPITQLPITCLDVGYDASSKPYVFIGVTTTFDADGPDDIEGNTDDDTFGNPTGAADILYIDELAIGATWISLDLSCYSCGGFIPYAVGCTPDFATAPTKMMAVVTSPFTMNFNLNTAGVVTVTAGASPAYVTYGTLPAGVTYSGGASPDILPAGTATFTCAGTGTGEASICLDVTGLTATVAVTTPGVTLGSTHVISSTLGVCGWGEVAELVRNCNPAVAANHFEIDHSSRIGYPDDYTDARTLFAGVASVSDYLDGDGVYVVTAGGDGVTEGGDVYSVVTAPAGTSSDLNVAGSTGGCVGLTVGTDICGVDVCGDTADAAVMAGAMDDTNAYTSIDGGWTWAISKKDPTGVNETWVQWVGDDCAATALAATKWCDCAVSITCGPDIGVYWNQASLINTCIDCVLVVDHSPGYYQAGTSDTLFMLTTCDDACVRPADQRSFSVFRYEGDPTLAGTSSPAHPWERVFSSLLYAAEIDTENLFGGVDPIDFLMVSPDFQTTSAVFIGNPAFEIWRSLDAGCSWFKFAYPCAPRPSASAMIAVDKETVVVGGQLAGATKVWKTTRHGTRPFSLASITGAVTGTWPTSFDFDGANFLMGDSASQVFISADGALTWKQVDGALDATGFMTSVIFDPGYAVTGDAGENTIYAAADDDIYRCVIDPALLMSAQTWYSIYTDADASFWGMAVAGDTVLYVGDRAAVGASLSLGGMVRSLNPTAPAALIAFERVNFGLVAADDLTSLQLTPFTAYNCGMPLTSGVNGCPNSNVLWAVDRCATGTRVWFFEDTLARQVDLVSPSNGAKGLSAVIGTTSATIEWEAICGATCYEKEVWFYCPGCDDKTMVAPFPECFDCSTTVPCVGCSGETCCEVVSGLSPGVTYYWRVRVGGVPGECDGCPMLSKWSDTYTFTTAMLTPVRCSPICGAEDITLTPNFSWSEIFGATGYEIEVATNEDFDPLLASGTPTINAWDGIPQLDYGTTYYWRVRAVKNGVVGAWTYCLFSTEEAPPEAPPQVWVCPQCGLTFTSEAALQAHIDEAHAPAATPAYIWIIIGIGAALVIAVLILIVTTRRAA